MNKEKKLISKILKNKTKLNQLIPSLDRITHEYNTQEHRFNIKSNYLNLIRYGIYGPKLSVVKDWLGILVSNR